MANLNYSPYNTGSRVNYYGQVKIPVVNGREGAENYGLGPDSGVILLDVSGKMIWIITTDCSGYKTVQGYDITLHVDPEKPDYNILMTKLNKMEEILYGLVSATNNTGTNGLGGATNATTEPIAPENDNSNAFAKQF